ncbi:DUF3180 family protein [Frigoribacterium sp. RIT-PI-h]|uniref:DUF3180 family protein n=1 Tax=Frigoribacterium sp. RIT-PI-h TaxID=1690245 RepID=UPI0006B8FED8|nr:DUF3180 family protein [Frigoribacterium sp. RIT-PI-h]KPG88431.1 hypothetical protein AEQ27_01280 [Frigoribacterium sp. RIT-PI-h]
MKHTRPSTLVGLIIVAVAAGFVLDSVLVALRQPSIVLPVALGLVLLGIGGVVVSMAVPVHRVATGSSKERVDPYYATRVLLLAKASSLSGALFGGFAGGVLLFVLSRGVGVAVGSPVPAIVAVAGGAGLLVAGTVAERMCPVPPADDENGQGPGTQAV